MPLWGNTDDAANSVNYATELTRSGPQGSGSTAKAANNLALYANVTPDAFGSNLVVGQFAVTPAEFANSSAPDLHGPQHAGWNMRYEGTGPVATLAFTANGATFANGETVTVSGGSINATGVITSNSAGNGASIAVSVPGSGFANVSTLTYTFNREKHVASVVVGGTPTGYSNTDTIVFSNGTVNATATVSTNSIGGFVTANLTITNVGLFDHAKVAGDLAVVVLANTGANSAGSGATFTPTLANSSGGTAVATLGGRAGRVFYETIVAMSSISSTGNTIPANT